MATHWVSEGGAIEFALFGGPSAPSVLRQLSAMSGRPPMPPLWAMGYHHSHWNIKSQPQAAALDENFDRHGAPLDGMWLDIEHTDGKRYFTWVRARARERARAHTPRTCSQQSLERRLPTAPLGCTPP